MQKGTANSVSVSGERIECVGSGPAGVAVICTV